MNDVLISMTAAWPLAARCFGGTKIAPSGYWHWFGLMPQHAGINASFFNRGVSCIIFG
jgi:hypothetical protein